MKSPKEIAIDLAEWFEKLKPSRNRERIVAEKISEAIQHERDEAEKKLDRIRDAIKLNVNDSMGARTACLSAFDSARNEK